MDQPIAINLPESIHMAVVPLFDALPLEQTMTQLVVTQGGPTELIQRIIDDPALADHPALRAGLWLYVDQLDASHRISQAIKNSTGSFWHGIMHRREGDFSNSHYWFRHTGSHPAMDLITGYDGHALIDDVESCSGTSTDAAPLIDRQRREWAALFEWCANQD